MDMRECLIDMLERLYTLMSVIHVRNNGGSVWVQLLKNVYREEELKCHLLGNAAGSVIRILLCRMTEENRSLDEL